MEVVIDRKDIVSADRWTYYKICRELSAIGKYVRAGKATAYRDVNGDIRIRITEEALESGGHTL